MARSRKDQRGGHAKVGIPAAQFSYVWGESGKRFAKRWKAKLCRRHTKVSIRDLELVTPFEAEEEHEDFEWYVDNYDDPYDDYDDPYDDYEYQDPYEDVYWDYD